MSTNASPGECVTERTTELNTAQTERVLTRPVVTPLLRLAVCIKPEECCTCHPCIDCVSSCVVLPVLHAQLHNISARVLRSVLQESRIDDHWNVDMDRSLSDSWTGITKFTSLNETTSQRIYVVRGAACQDSSNCQTRLFVA